jgi:hypothetical protein
VSGTNFGITNLIKLQIQIQGIKNAQPVIYLLRMVAEPGIVAAVLFL